MTSCEDRCKTSHVLASVGGGLVGAFVVVVEEVVGEEKRGQVAAIGRIGSSCLFVWGQVLID